MMSVATNTYAQELSPEDIARMVDDKVSQLNPYQALLNDPDPERSLAAMQIMLDSGDANLQRMALEFGLLSPNTTVKRLAFESWLVQEPVISIRFDGSDVKDRDFPGYVRGYYDGNISDNIGYWRIGVGGYDNERKCFTFPDNGNCFVTVNADGIFLTTSYFNGRGSISEEGLLVGSGSMYRVDEPVPFTVQVLD